jgi:hypothetical protein
MDPDPDPGGPKTCGSGFGSGSATLLCTDPDPFMTSPLKNDVKVWYLQKVKKKKKLRKRAGS